MAEEITFAGKTLVLLVLESLRESIRRGDFRIILRFHLHGNWPVSMKFPMTQCRIYCVNYRTEVSFIRAINAKDGISE